MRRILSGVVAPLFVLGGAGGLSLLAASPAASPIAAVLTACPTYGSGSCTGTGTGTVGQNSNGTTDVSGTAGGFHSGETVNGTVQQTSTTTSYSTSVGSIQLASAVRLDAASSFSVGSFTANSTGVVDYSVTLPGGLPAGTYDLILVGSVSGVTDTIPFTLTAATAATTPCAASYSTNTSNVVLAACATAIPPAATPSAAAPAATQTSSSLPFTGANVATGVAVAAIALAGGGMLVLSSRRRRRSAWEAK